MVFCAAINCSNSSNKQKTYEVKGWHKVPVKKELRKKWITAMKRNPPFPSENNFVLCGMHFRDECFQRDLKVFKLLKSLKIKHF